MRNFKKNQPNKINKYNEIPYYSPIIQNRVKPLIELLRARNYYCTNNSKEDYNFACPELAWDESSNSAH